jgi:hypothetical protein
MDEEIVQETQSGVRAGDAFEINADRLDLASGTEPYCFKLKTDHNEGALSAVAPYKPWWADLKDNWTSINALKTKFKLWTKDKERNVNEKETHNAMNSGKLVIHFGQEEDEFLDYYAKCLLAGKRMYFVEKTNYDWPIGCFRLYIDLDFQQLQGITERGVEAASCVCATTVASFFKRKSHCIVASTTYANKTEVSKEGIRVPQIKTGVHLYWPNHIVTAHQILNLRLSVLASLTEAFGLRCPPEMNPWEKVFDESVYDKPGGKRGAGLRMLGSCKTESCSACNEKKVGPSGQRCEKCFGSGKTDVVDTQGRVGRPYMMLCVLNEPDDLGRVNGRNYGLEQMYKNSMHQLIKDTKIRSSITPETLDNSYEMPAGAPTYEAEAAKKKKHGTTREREITLSDPINLELQRVIREAFGPLYARVVVRKSTRAAKGLHYTVSVTGSNCRFCQNINREHNSNNIYFLVSKDGIFQRCFDDGPRTPEMQFSSCKDYSGGGIPLSSDAIAILWPQETFTFTETASTFEMKALLNTAEYLCNTLYGASWTSTLGFKSKRSGKLKEFLPQDPRDLGSRGLEAYKDLGLAWADALISLKAPKEEDRKDATVHKSIAHYENALFNAFDTIVLLAAADPDPDKFEAFEFLDDVVKNL